MQLIDLSLALVIDMGAKTAGDEITVADLERAAGGDLSAGDRLLIRTDWDEQADTDRCFTEFVPLTGETAIKLMGADGAPVPAAAYDGL